MRDQGPGRGHGVVAARADAQDAVGRLDHVASAADQQRVLGVDHGQQRFQPPQRPVGPPFLGQFGRRPRHVAGIVLELGLEPLQQGEGIGAAAGEADEHLAVAAAGGSCIASAFMIVVPSVTWPSPPMATLPLMADGENGGGVEFHGSMIGSDTRACVGPPWRAGGVSLPVCGVTGGLTSPAQPSFGSRQSDGKGAASPLSSERALQAARCSASFLLRPQAG